MGRIFSLFQSISSPRGAMFATFKSLFREKTMFDNMEAMLVQVPMTSRAMLGNIFTLFQSLLSPRWAMFTTLKSLSRGRTLEIVTSGAMFDHMEAMLVRKCSRSWT